MVDRWTVPMQTMEILGGERYEEDRNARTVTGVQLCICTLRWDRQGWLPQ